MGHIGTAQLRAHRLKTGIGFLCWFLKKKYINKSMPKQNPASECVVKTLGTVLSILAQPCHYPSRTHRYFVAVEFSAAAAHDLPERWIPALPNWQALGKHNKTSVCKCARQLPAYFHSAHGSVRRPPAHTGFRVERWQWRRAGLSVVSITDKLLHSKKITTLCTEIKTHKRKSLSPHVTNHDNGLVYHCQLKLLFYCIPINMPLYK